MFHSVYTNKRAFVTGHTGFKGSWLYAWLERLGASVCGYALAPPTKPSHHACLERSGESVIADIRDYPRLLRAIQEHQPEIVFHLAAQPSVLVSYEDPVETFSTNILGTAHLLEAIRQVPSVRAVIIVTTDKCYENKEWHYGYREIDSLGGHDPYSASKACTELVTASFRKSFFTRSSSESVVPLVATARAGNVIGGGDWTADRLLPDAVRAAASGVPVGIRNPHSSRPWQHVLESLSGYLRLGQVLLEGGSEYADAWNFGPALNSNLTTAEIIAKAGMHWSAISPEITPQANAPHEATLLMLDSTKAHRRLGWYPVWEINTTVQKTVQWYRTYYEANGKTRTIRQIEEYCQDATKVGAAWAI